ncbi:MAG TPA: prenyltransferase/squalene oxidase repeat-containing protein [Solirubrobacteraceae bacterium]|jgi:squalene-hopene/tetraprenyl-beta-curcumene cyclase
MAQLTLEARREAEQALELAREHLLSLQDDAGWWRGELQTNVTMDAEDMLLREFLGVRTTEETQRSAAWIRSQQRADGTWANFHGGPGELSTTVEAYWALRLAGDEPDAEHMRAAAEFIRGAGGIEAARVFTHLWLALFGLWSWDRVPALPPEVILLPPWVTLNVYDFACWARQTIVALSLVKARRPTRPLPFCLDELQATGAPPPPGAPSQRGRARTRRRRWLGRLDLLLRVYERRPLRPLRRVAIARAERWIVRRQESDGSWGGIQPPWVYSLIALHIGGYSVEHPVMRRGLEGLDGFMVEDRDDARGVGAPAGRSRRLEACQSPVWDTALSMLALSDAGVAADHPAMVQAAEWLLAEEVTRHGDWSVARPGLEPGGWAFEFANVNYPDVDDTAEVVLALERVGARPAPGGAAHTNGAVASGASANGASSNGAAGSTVSLQGRVDGAIGRALRWVQGMQSSGGGWAAFDADNTRAIVRALPFLDFGEVIDEPSADVTAHTLEMLAVLGLGHGPEARAGVRWLIENQEPGGSWFGRWGVNHVYGTGAAVPALIAAGVEPSHASIRRAVSWLEEHQKDDGGWGEDPRSYDDPRWVGRGPSTASQTAWALLALHAAGEHTAAVARGVGWLLQTQRSDGGWDEPQYTGTGFPSDYYINYHLYRLTFPIMALGRCLAEEPAPEACLAGASEQRD